MNTPCIDNVASINPKNVEPVSPINIFAGLKLNGKNPKHEPISAIPKIAIEYSPTLIDINTSDIDIIADTPAANPSRPSIKFTAFVMNTIHITVSVTESHSGSTQYGLSLRKFGFVNTSIFISPANTTTSAAII